MRRLVRISIICAFAIAIGLLVVINSILVWIATGPRDLGKFIPYVERSFTSPESGYALKISGGVLLWDGWQHPATIKLNNVEVLTQQGVVFARFPVISVGLDVLSLAVAEIAPAYIRLQEPVISLYRLENGDISFGINSGATEPQDNSQTLDSILEELQGVRHGPLSRLKEIEISDARLSLGNARQGVVFNLHDMQASFRRNHKELRLSLSALLPQGDVADAKLSVVTQQKKPHTPLNVSAYVSGLIPSSLAPLAPGMKEYSDRVKLPVTGWVQGNIQPDGTLHDAAFVMDMGEGEIITPELSAPLPITRVHGEGRLNREGVLRLDKLNMETAGTKVNVRGAIVIPEEKRAIRLEAALENFNAERVAAVWPPEVSPMSREWVVENIVRGTVTRATLKANISTEDLRQPYLSKKSVDARLAFEKLDVRYMPGHPEVRNASGVLMIDGVSLSAAVNQAEYLTDTKLTQGELLIPDLNVDNPRIEISFNAAASAADIATFLAQPGIELDKRIGISAASAGGSVAGKADIAFSFFAPRDEKGNILLEEAVEYKISGEVAGVSQPGFLGRFDVEDATGKVDVDNNGVAFTGSGRIFTVPATASVKYAFSPVGGVDTQLEAKANVTPALMEKLGYAAIPGVEGAVPAQISMRQGPSIMKVDVKGDLTPARVDIAPLSWSKPAGVPASISFTASEKSDAVAFSDIVFKAENASVKGAATLAGKDYAIQSLDFSDFRLGRSNCVLAYAPIDGGYRVRANGAALDITPIMEDDDGAFTFTGMPAFDIEAKLDTLITSRDGAQLDAIEAAVDCSRELCRTVAIRGTTGGEQGAFSFRIGDVNGKRVLDAKAGDAGAVLAALDIFQGRIKGGAMRLRGTFDDTAKGRPLSGRLVIDDMILMKAPSLTRLLTIASLTGIVDLLQGEGIRFAKLHAPYRLQGDVITLGESKMHGPSLGLTAEGTISFPKQMLDLKGTIVPSYTLNTAVDKVPLVGAVLTGGEGQGIFAARYTLKGPAEEPEVNVNPLSILTPGFLRGLFDVFDGERKEEE